MHVANAFGEMFARQGHLGAMPATVNDGLWDTPPSRHEAACASGSVAALAAIADLRSGAYRTALVIGVELEKTVPGDTAAAVPRRRRVDRPRGRRRQVHVAAHVRPASPVSTTGDTALDETHLRAIAQLNFANARTNPNAQTRDWTVPDLRRRPTTATMRSTRSSRAGLRRFDCSQMTDGGAGIVLVSDDWLRDHPDARPIGRIDGWGHRTVGLGLQQKLDRSADDPYVLPHVRGRCSMHSTAPMSPSTTSTASRFTTASPPASTSPSTTSALTGPGESWKAIENNEIEIGGRLPINPSGGLIGGGHPVGASGVRMLLDAAKQVSDGAGDYQVEGAKTFGTLNFGGSTATTVSFVVSGA